uniref:Transmembrane protein 68 n=1 Tax=Ficedula albicollis TaxID=59894 RepID=A0A803VYN0_FICAL
MQDMIGRKESCASGQLPMTSPSSLFYALEEWTVVEFLKTYLFYVIIGSLTISAILVFFIVPLTIVFFIYLSNILLLIYQRNNELEADPLSDVWNRVRKTIATFWDIYARIWHGYELHGVENLPEGPGILVYYHGAIPIDYLYFLSRLFLWKKRLCLSVADHFVFRLPGLKLLLGVTGVIPGTRQECLAALRSGYLVSISPGGVREALFSDESYQLMWGSRKGFAQVALEAKVVSAIPCQSQFLLSAYLLHYKMQLRSICWKIFQEKRLGNKDFISFSHRFPRALSFRRSKSFVELSNVFLTVSKDSSLWFHVYSSTMWAFSVSS